MSESNPKYYSYEGLPVSFTLPCLNCGVPVTDINLSGCCSKECVKEYWK